MREYCSEHLNPRCYYLQRPWVIRCSCPQSCSCQLAMRSVSERNVPKLKTRPKKITTRDTCKIIWSYPLNKPCNNHIQLNPTGGHHRNCLSAEFKVTKSVAYFPSPSAKHQALTPTHMHMHTIPCPSPPPLHAQTHAHNYEQCCNWQSQTYWLQISSSMVHMCCS